MIFTTNTLINSMKSEVGIRQICYLYSKLQMQCDKFTTKKFIMINIMIYCTIYKFTTLVRFKDLG